MHCCMSWIKWSVLIQYQPDVYNGPVGVGMPLNESLSKHTGTQCTFSLGK